MTHAGRSLAVVLSLLVCSAQGFAQGTGVFQPSITSIRSVRPPQGAQGVALDHTSTIRFSLPIDAATVDSASIVVTSGGVPIPRDFHVSLNRQFVTMTYPQFLPAEALVEVAVDGNLLRDAAGLAVDANGDGVHGGIGVFTFTTGPGADPPLDTDTAIVLGTVWEADGTTPIQGAMVQSWYYPPGPNDFPINVPPGVSDASGNYTYQTIAFTGTETFLVRISRTGYSEKLKQVTVVAGACARFDAVLQPLTPPVPVVASEGAVLTDPAGEVLLDIPPDALAEDSDIGVTVLADASLLRDALPPRVAPNGTFTDMAGVFGNETSAPVTFRVPNIYDLPLGTRVPLGKIDHFTLEWIDLRDAYTGPPPVPDEYLGKVVSDGNGGTVIEVQFDHFCTVCTGYCGNVPDPGLGSGGGPGGGPPPPPCGGMVPEGQMEGSSYVSRHEGFLWERIALPAVTELGHAVGPALVYSSAAARPTATLRASVDFNSPRPVERTSFRFELEGLVVDAVYGFSQNNVKHHATFIWDGKDALGQLLPTGSYPYTVQATSLNAESAVAVPDVFGGPSIQEFAMNFPGLLAVPTPIETRRTGLVNLVDSPFGAGWTCSMEARLHFDGDGQIVEVDGQGSWTHFVPQEGSTVIWERSRGVGHGIVRNPQTNVYTLDDPSGESLVFAPDGLLTSRIDRDGRVTAFFHDGAQRLTSIVTPTGYQWTFAYDGAGKLQSIADSVGRQTLIMVDGFGDLVSVTDALGSSRSFQYDSDHLLVENDGPRGERSVYQYTNGRIVSTQAYDTDGATLLQERTYAPSVLNGEMGAALAMGLGTLADPIPVQPSREDVVVDGRGAALVQVSDDAGQTREVRDGLGSSRFFDYDAEGQLESMTGAGGARTGFEYDAEGRLIAVREYMPGGALYSTRTMEYVPGTEDVARIVDPEGKQTLLGYDSLGRPTALEDSLGGQVLFEYQDPSWTHLTSRITLPNGYVREMTYDSHGNLASLTDYPNPVGQPMGRTRTVTYDAAGNQTAVVKPDGLATVVSHDALNRITSYVDELLRTVTVDYSETGGGGCGCSTRNINRVILPDLSEIQYEYDGLNRRTLRRDASAVSDVYQYDGEGLRTAWTNRAGETITYVYDAARQLVSKELPGGDVTTFAYDELGGLVHAADSECELEFEYDFLGREITARTYLDEELRGGSTFALEHTLTRTFDKVGNRLTLADSLGLVELDYGYDDLHRLTSIVPTGTSAGWVLGYGAWGGRTSIDRQIAGVLTTIARNDADGVVAIHHGAAPALQATYSGFNGVPQLTQASVQTLGQVFGLSFAYGDDRRLLSATTGQVHGDSQVSLTYVTGAGNRLQSDGEYTYTYDAAGRLLTRSSSASSLVEEFDWDTEGMLVGYREVDGGTTLTLLEVIYTYDPLGRRVGKSINGVLQRFVYDGDDIVLTLDGRNAPEWGYVHGPGVDDPLAAIDVVNGDVLELLRDRQHSVIALADSTGLVVQAYLFGEYGDLLEEASTNVRQPYGFASRERDLESGLYFNRARYYEPSLGRFVSEDPIGLSGGWNPYEYVESDPVNLLDPFGLSSECNDDCWHRVYTACVERIRRDNQDMLDASEKLHFFITCVADLCFLPGAADPLHDGGGAYNNFLWQCKEEADRNCR